MLILIGIVVYNEQVQRESKLKIEGVEEYETFII